MRVHELERLRRGRVPLVESANLLIAGNLHIRKCSQRAKPRARETLNGVRWLDFRADVQASRTSRNPAHADPPAESSAMYQWPRSRCCLASTHLSSTSHTSMKQPTPTFSLLQAVAGRASRC